MFGFIKLTKVLVPTIEIVTVSDSGSLNAGKVYYFVFPTVTV